MGVQVTIRIRAARAASAGAIFVGTAIATTFIAVGCGGSSKLPGRPAAVNTITLVGRPISITEEYPAQIEASNTVEIRPRVGGVLERQSAVEGQRVKAGQILFEIDPQPYRAALAQAQAALALAEAAQAQAVRDLSRAKPLSALDALSQRELDAAEAANAATLAQVRAAQASVKTAELNLGYTTVRSPIDGDMSRAQIRIGGLVTAYTTLLTTVYQTDPMYINFSIGEQRLLQLQRELGRPPDQRNPSKRRFRVFLANAEEIDATAELNFVDAAVDLRTDTLPLRLVVPNPKSQLRAGQYAKVTVDTAARPDSLSVPQRAVQELQDKNFVWIVDGSGKAQMRDITLGPRVGSDILVEKGLAAGDVVVVDGIQKLKPGSLVDASQPTAADKRKP